MRLLSRVLTTTFALAGLTGCGLILGSFTTGGGPTSDAGPDSAQDGGSDAPDGAAPKVLGCVIDGVPHKTGYTPPPDPDDQPFAIHALQTGRRIAFRATVANRRRIIVRDVQPDGSNITQVPVPTPSSNSDVIAFGNFDGGFGFVFYDPDTSTMNASMLLDKDSTATTPIAIPFADPVPASPTAFAAAIVPLDLANGVFFVAVAWAANNQPQMDLYAGAVRVAGSGPLLPPLWKHMTFQTKINFESGHVLLDHASKHATLLLPPNQGVGQGQLVNLDFSQNGIKPAIRPLDGVNGGSVLLGFTSPNIGAGGGNGGLFLSGDLAKPQVPIGFVSGIVDDDKIWTFDLKSMPPQIVLPTIDDLAVDKSNAEWRFFPNLGPHALIVGRFTGTGSGVNMLWLDGAGQLRGKASGATALVPNASVAGAAGTFRTPPTAVFAPISLVWKTDAKEIFIADVTCK